MQKIPALLTIPFIVFTMICHGESGWTILEKDYDYKNGEKHEALCSKIQAQLKSNTVKNFDRYINNSCASSTLLSFAEFKEAPWIELDSRKHEQLIYELRKLIDIGEESYFGRQHAGELTRWQEMTEEQRIKRSLMYQEEVEEFVEKGGKLLLWKKKIVTDFRLKGDSTPAPENQTVVLLKYPTDARPENRLACPNLNIETSFNSLLFFVTEDLVRPDPRVGYTGSFLFGTYPMLWDNQVVFLAGGGPRNVYIAIDEGFGPHGICEVTDYDE